jgi:plasmid stabilization system protein ParE
MGRRVRYTDASNRDLAGIRKWLTQPGAGTAAKLKARRIARAIRELAQTPLRWKSGNKPNTRERLVAGHTIVYSVQNDIGDEAQAGDVTVIRVFGPG